ncbi:MAG TPA: serine/threonine-protein kinase [Kofleriaceae bacterium]|nr:serine/threonine-protein kinase [Kofleriaceae bacterium]
MPDILAIVSKAVFERDARVDGKLIEPGDVWPVDRYTSTQKVFEALEDGGRIFLVTVRPPSEQLWFVGVVGDPAFDGTAWIADAPNTLPVTDISALRKTITFESGKGMSQDRGTLGMSLQTPRTLTAGDVEQILAAVSGKKPKPRRAAPKKPQPARVIGGKYEITRELGRGGMGVVYEAKHAGTGRRVAVKEIIGDAAKKDRKLIERFQREARATAAIETRYIASVLDAGTDPATKNPFLVIELLQGEDLQEHINRSGPLPEATAIRIVAQACSGLARAHAAGVVHRDIKPANLFLARRDGEIVVTLLDFGVARVKQELTTESLTLTSTGLMLGTPLYMSPEQVVGAKDLDHRTDLWALGVVLYELICGVTPYNEAETLGALLVAICSRPARPLREFAPQVSDGVQAVAAKALALDPEKRYQTADELLADLARLLPDGMRLDEAMLPLGKRTPSRADAALAATSPSK